MWNAHEATINVRLRPRFYQATSFRIVLILIFATVILGAHRARTYQLKKRQKELELVVQQRTEELQKEVTERRRAEEAFRFQATHDQMTGLFNRRAILDALEVEISRAERGRTSLAMLLIDVDKFKHINDT